MSIFRPAVESRSLSYQDVWGAGGNWAPGLGADTIRGALSLAPVYSAVGLICDLISTAPRRVVTESTPGVIKSLPVQPALVLNPSPFVGSYISWMHQGLASVLLRGNAIGYIVAIDGAGTPTKIIWFNPDDVTIIEEQNDWYHTPTYYWRGRLLDPLLVVHVPGFVVGGSCKGYSPLGLFKKQIETGLQAQQTQLDWYTNGAHPSGWFKNTGQEISPGDAVAIKARFKEAVANRDLLVTGSDWDWTALSVPADQAQFLQAIEANATTVASIYHLSAEDVGGSTGGATGGKSATYKTLEQDSLKMIQRALAPWAARFEEAISLRLPPAQTFKINLRHLAKGSMLEQAQTHQIMLNSGQETQGEARVEEGREPMTPEQITFWQENYNTKYTNPAVDDSADDAADVAVDPNDLDGADESGGNGSDSSD